MSRLYLGDFNALEAALAEDVRAAKRHDPLAPVTVVVGSAAVASRLPRLLAVRLGGHANVRVVTVHRLATQLAAAGGLPAQRLLTTEGQARLVERIAGQIASRPGSYFGPVAGMPGLARAFLRSIEDLRQAGVSADSDWGPLHGGVADARAALCSYESALRVAGCADRAGAYWAALEAVKADSDAFQALVPVGARVMVYGLYDLPQSQRVLLSALAERRVVSAFLPYPAAGREYAEPGRQFFAGLGLKTVELASSAPPPTELLSVGDDEDEVLATARYIRQLTAAGVRYHQIAVVAPADERAQAVARGLGALGISVARRLPPCGGAVGRVLCLLEAAFPAAGRPWTRAGVIEHAAALAGAEDGLRAAEVASWTDESRRAGVVAADDWQRLADRRRYLTARLADLQAGSDDAEAPVSAGAAQAYRRSLQAVDSLMCFVEGLRAAVSALPEHAPWPQMAAALTSLAGARCAVATDDPALGALADLTSCGLIEDSVSLADAARVARDRLRRVTEAHGSVGRRGVAVLTPHEIRGLGFSVVIFTGLCSGGFPPAAAHDPVLPDAERRELARRLALPLTEVGGREREADMLCALARAAAADSFVGLVPRRDAAGAERQPSRVAVELAEGLIGRVAAAEDFLRAPLTGAPLRRVPSGVPPAVVSHGALRFPEGRRPADLRDLDVSLLAMLQQGLRGGSAAGPPRRYLEQVCGVRGARRLLGRRLAGVSSGVLAWDGVFHSRRARRTIAAAGLFSGPQAPTALQEYARCPFSYYVLAVLGVDPVEEPEALVEADRREVGKVVHRVLQRVFAAVAEGAGREAAVAMVPAIAEQECRRAELRGGVGLPLVWQAQSAQLAEDLTLAVAADRCWSEPAGPQPWQFELSFGDHAAPVVLHLADGRSVQFHGRMDRVDRSADGRRLLVLDYKSGKGKAEKEQVQAGRNIQLPVYQLACRALLAGGSDVQIGGAFRMVTRRREQAEVALTMAEAQAAQNLAVTVAATRRLVEAGVFPRVAASERMCEWCAAAYACDELQVASRSKREHPALAELARLRQPAEGANAPALTPDGEDSA